MDRIQSVDMFRVVAILAVIALHTQPFEVQSTPIGTVLDLATLINLLARFAVPFFFVVSGFFWASRFRAPESAGEPTWRMSRRIAFLFVAWSIIYVLPTSLGGEIHGPLELFKYLYWSLLSACRDPMALVFQGTRVHLWFLFSLLLSLAISAFFIGRKLERQLIVLSLALYIFGLIGKAYADTPIGVHLAFNTRNGPFFGLLFFVTGYFLHRRGAKQSWFFVGLIMAVVGACMHISELVALNKIWNTSMDQDFVVGTYFFGVGVSLIALSNHPVLRVAALSSIGPLVLGVYAIHLLLVDMLGFLDKEYEGAVLWEMGHPLMVFLLSGLLAYVLSRNRFTKAMVV